ncbi:hypothetical protein V8C86DRAFT_250315 [Haematococcus lacustris]
MLTGISTQASRQITHLACHPSLSTQLMCVLTRPDWWAAHSMHTFPAASPSPARFPAALHPAASGPPSGLQRAQWHAAAYGQPSQALITGTGTGLGRGCCPTRFVAKVMDFGKAHRLPSPSDVVQAKSYATITHMVSHMPHDLPCHYKMHEGGASGHTCAVVALSFLLPDYKKKHPLVVLQTTVNSMASAKSDCKFDLPTSFQPGTQMDLLFPPVVPKVLEQSVKGVAHYSVSN